MKIKTKIIFFVLLILVLFNISNTYASTIDTFKLFKIDRLIEKEIKKKKNIIKKKQDLINKLLKQYENNFTLLLN